MLVSRVKGDGCGSDALQLKKEPLNWYPAHTETCQCNCMLSELAVVLSLKHSKYQVPSVECRDSGCKGYQIGIGMSSPSILCLLEKDSCTPVMKSTYGDLKCKDRNTQIKDGV